jgi:hypothetical protein
MSIIPEAVGSFLGPWGLSQLKIKAPDNDPKSGVTAVVDE